MAVIVATTLLGSGVRTAAVTVLGASDTLTYKPGSLLTLNNVSAGALTPNLSGDESTSYPVKGIGDVDTSAGITLASIGAGESAVLPLDSYSEYLKGVVTVTGGDAIEVTLLEY